MLKILGRVSSINVRKVLWVADEAGLAYEREDWGLPGRDPHAEEFLALNPNAQVPVIIDDGFVLWESNVIMRYLAEKAVPDALLPQIPRHRALAEQWLQWQATELNPTWGYAFRGLVRKEEGFDDPDRIADSARRWTGKMQMLEAHLQKAGDFAANDKFSLADIALGLSAHRWAMTPIADKPTLPAIEGYLARLKSRPAGARYLAAETP